LQRSRPSPSNWAPPNAVGRSLFATPR